MQSSAKNAIPGLLAKDLSKIRMQSRREGEQQIQLPVPWILMSLRIYIFLCTTFMISAEQEQVDSIFLKHQSVFRLEGKGEGAQSGRDFLVGIRQIVVSSPVFWRDCCSSFTR